MGKQFQIDKSENSKFLQDQARGSTIRNNFYLREFRASDWWSTTNHWLVFPEYFLSMIDGLWTIGDIQTEDPNGVTLEPRENIVLI